MRTCQCRACARYRQSPSLESTPPSARGPLRQVLGRRPSQQVHVCGVWTPLLARITGPLLSTKGARVRRSGRAPFVKWSQLEVNDIVYVNTFHPRQMNRYWSRKLGRVFKFELVNGSLYKVTRAL